MPSRLCFGKYSAKMVTFTQKRAFMGIILFLTVVSLAYLVAMKEDMALISGSALTPSIPRRIHRHNSKFDILERKEPLTIESILKTHARGKGRNDTRLYLDFHSEDGDLTTLLNAHCQDKYTVPPIVHYVWFNKKMMEIHEYISVYSMNKFVKPCYILFHGNKIPEGKWWDLLLTQVHNIVHVQTEPPGRIFGKRVRIVEHQSDILRLQVLMKYGGIYADTDMYALRSFDELRKYNMTMERVDGIDVSNGIMLANKDAVFLKIWMLTYHTFNDGDWGGNSVVMASHLSRLVPRLVHLERNRMVRVGKFNPSVYQENLSWDDSRYSVHLYARFFTKRDYELEDLKHLRNTYGALSRYILFGNRDLVPK